MTTINPALNYEEFFVPAIGAPLAADLIRQSALRPGERVLDVACGTGVVARLAAERVGAEGDVTGLDINAAMLAVARSTTPPELPIVWHEASAESMPFADASFDVVLCQMGLQFMPDKLSALNEMARVLVPGGRLSLNLPGPAPQLFSIMEEAFGQHVGPEAAGFVNQVFSLHDTEEIQGLVRSAGFHDVSVQVDNNALPLPPPKEFLWQYIRSTPLVGAVAKIDDKRRTSLERGIVPQWEKFVQDDDLVLNVRMVTVHALA